MKRNLHRRPTVILLIVSHLMKPLAKVENGRGSLSQTQPHTLYFFGLAYESLHFLFIFHHFVSFNLNVVVAMHSSFKQSVPPTIESKKRNVM